MGTNYNEVLVNEEFAYIPLLQSLEQMLNQPTVLDQVLSKLNMIGVYSSCYAVLEFCSYIKFHFKEKTH